MWNGRDAGSKHAWSSTQSHQGHHSPLLYEKKVAKSPKYKIQNPGW